MESQVSFPIDRSDLQTMMVRNPDEIRTNAIVTIGKTIANGVVMAAREGRGSFMYFNHDHLTEYGKDLEDYLKTLITNTYVAILTQADNRLYLRIDWSNDVV